ncbi:MAG: superoxide dismutase [Myxococcales bacterium]|nr:superoxide dismutase [Myxococcales bacterium]
MNTRLALIYLMIPMMALACSSRQTANTNSPEPMDDRSDRISGPTNASADEEARPGQEPPADKASLGVNYVDPGAKEPAPVKQAVAVMHPTEGNGAQGTVTFTAAPGGLKVKADLKGLPEGQHAYHFHLYGDCTADDGTSAGTHFNLNGSSKSPPEGIKRITGNLGELKAGADGRATAEAMIEGASLHGRYAVLGRAVIVHAKGNDATQPPIGAAGGRLACGVVGLTEAM